MDFQTIFGVIFFLASMAILILGIKNRKRFPLIKRINAMSLSEKIEILNQLKEYGVANDFQILEKENLKFTKDDFFKEVTIICTNSEIATTLAEDISNKKIHQVAKLVESTEGVYGIFIMVNDYVIITKGTEDIINLLP